MHNGKISIYSKYIQKHSALRQSAALPRRRAEGAGRAGVLTLSLPQGYFSLERKSNSYSSLQLYHTVLRGLVQAQLTHTHSPLEMRVERWSGRSKTVRLEFYRVFSSYQEAVALPLGDGNTRYLIWKPLSAY